MGFKTLLLEVFPNASVDTTPVPATTGFSSPAAPVKSGQRPASHGRAATHSVSISWSSLWPAASLPPCGLGVVAPLAAEGVLWAEAVPLGAHPGSTQPAPTGSWAASAEAAGRGSGWICSTQNPCG